jgi:hypothetical protein
MSADPGNEVQQEQDPLIGSKVGPCRVEKRLAAGGMGVVYRAHYGPSDQDVALKVLAPSLSNDQEYVTRFFREAGAAGQIDHPNVVRVIDVGRHQEYYYLIMEYVPGETLDLMIERERRMSLEKATRLARGIASGLAAAHRQGIVHRDVKPGNVIVSRDHQPHLTDFGLARHAETRKGLTIEGTFLGTPEYASPEQVEGKKIDHRTDLYSLGVTYYQLLSGSLPFFGESPMEIAIKRTKEDPRPLNHALPTADERSVAIADKLLKRDPAQRYQSATDLLKDLDAILTGQQPQVVAKSPTTKHGATTRRAPVLNVQVQRGIRAAMFWTMVALSMALAFGSGAIARPGSFVGAWTAADPERLLRILLLAGSLLAAGAGIFAYRRELVYSGRLWSLLLLLPLMILLSLAAGGLLERPEVSGAPARLGEAVKALARSALTPPNVLAAGLLLLLGATLASFEHEGGTSRIWLCRLAVVGGFALLYVFGAGKAGMAAPVVHFLDEPELAIPLATGVLLAAFFGTLLLTGYGFESASRFVGLVLCATTAGGAYAYALLISQRGRHGWLGPLLEPFGGMGGTALASGTLILVVGGLGLIARTVVTTGVRRHDRFYKKK